MTKFQLRKKYTTLRNSLSKEEVEVFSREIFERFKLNFEVKAGQKVHLFLSIEKFNEVDTSSFINYFKEMKVRVFVPKIVDQRLISIEIKEDTDLKMSSWGINEPTSNEDCGVVDYDFVITPLLYCDQKGNRVGYGKGFYDQFFTSIKPNARKIGVGFFKPLEEIEDVHENDVAIDYLLTPTESIAFNGLL